jgi:uncharacterized protein YdbL (DUF1318 family)
MTVVSGVCLGAPGPVGTTALVYIFRHTGDPATSTDVNVAQASAASLYLRIDTGQLYVKATDGSWTAK